jgi:DNA gyrase subunit A
VSNDYNSETIEHIDLEEEMKTSYLRYAMSVIVSRALPDVRDGLKPSQRRIMVSLNDLNLNPRAKYRKCAKIVGDTNGNYHPHGDSAVYQTLVRLAQNFSIRYPFVDGQGNFGSIDGDPPAAMRYTEARMASPSTEMLADLEYNTVDYTPNYDETRNEPTVLPSKFPGLLCNGASGIAVGFATNLAPHNLNEICNGISYLLDQPDCEVDDLLLHVTGPDFPTGGVICGRSGFVDAYRKGRGKVILRAKYHEEDLATAGKKNLVFTEIPYQVNKTNIIDKIVDCVKDQKIKGIADVRDESDKDGLRLIIELKKGEDENIIVNQLFNYTPLQITFAIHNIALVDGKPVRLNLKQMMEHYRDHRIEVIRRKTQFLLDKAEARAHILEGLRIAIDNIDAIIALIRAAQDTASAKEQLMERFGLSDRQAAAILEMQLRRLTGLERDKIEEEYRELLVKIAEYKEILANENLVLDIIREDLSELKKKYGEDRRSEVGPATSGITDEDMIQDEEMMVMISHGGYIKRLPPNDFRTQSRGGVGVSGMTTQENDFTETVIVGSTKDYLLLFSNQGRVFWIKIYEIPLASRNGKGRSINNLINLEDGEKIVRTINVKEFDDRELIMATAKGHIKKTVLSAYGHPKKRLGIIAMVLSEGDGLIDVQFTNGENEVVLTSKQGLSIRFKEEEVRSMGRVSRGVKGMSLKDGDQVVSMNIVEDDKLIMTICEKGYGKKSSFEDYRCAHRGGKGVKTVGNIERNGQVVSSITVAEDDELLMMTQEGIVVRISTADFRVLGRATAGVRLMKFKKDNDRIVSVVPLSLKEEATDIPKEASEELSESSSEEGSSEENS